MERASEARGCDSGAFGWTTERERPARSTLAKRPRAAPKKACSAGAPNRSGARDRLTSKARRTQPRPVAHHHLLRSSTLVRSQVLGMPPHQVACDQRRVAAPGCLTTRTRAPSDGGPRVASRCDRSAQSLDEFEHGPRARHSNEGATASRDELACERPAATAQTLTCRHRRRRFQSTGRDRPCIRTRHYCTGKAPVRRSAYRIHGLDAARVEEPR